MPVGMKCARRTFRCVLAIQLPPMQKRPNERSRMGTTNQKTTLRVTSQTKTQRTFTRMTQGRRYDNGMTLQPASTVRGGGEARGGW